MIIDDYRVYSINRLNVGLNFSLALCSDHHFTYVEGAGLGYFDGTTQQFRCNGHDYENGMVLRISMTAGTLPVPLELETDYHVVEVLRDGINDWFKVSATPGGTPIVITSGSVGGKYIWRLHRIPVTVDTATNVITATGHPFVNGERVSFDNVGGGLPAGVATNTNYYVRDTAPNTFKIAATRGGAAIDITSVGSGINRVFTPELSAIDLPAVWLNREVFSYGSSARQTWVGTSTTSPNGEERTLSIIPLVYPVPCRWAYQFLTDGVNIGKFAADLGPTHVIPVGGRTFTTRDFHPA